MSLTPEQRACPHTNLTPTGEIRNTSGCKARQAVVARPVLQCECGASFVAHAGKPQLVQPSMTPAQVVEAIKQGRVNRKLALAQYGNFTPEELAQVAEAEPCPHQQWEPIIMVYKCACCGRLKHDKVVVQSNTAQR